MQILKKSGSLHIIDDDNLEPNARFILALDYRWPSFISGKKLPANEFANEFADEFANEFANEFAHEFANEFANEFAK